MSIYDSVEQSTKTRSKCFDNNGSCQHICMTKSSDEITCACALGFSLFNLTACVDRPQNIVVRTSDKFGLEGIGFKNGNILTFSYIIFWLPRRRSVWWNTK